MLKKEWISVFKTPRLAISILGIISIPILYGFMFIWSFYDPYGKVDKLPIAIVNNDEGSELNGEKIDLGETLVNNLKDKDNFNFHFVEHDTGYEKLEDKEFYLLVEIPKNFSKNATTALDKNPEKLELIYVPNEGYNYIGAQIGKNMIKEIQIAIQEEVTKSYTEIMFESIRKLADGYETLKDASGELNTGAAKLYDGTETLEVGLNELAKNQATFANSTNDLAAGSQKLQTGAKDLSNGLGQLLDAQQQLVDGSAQTAAGSQNLKDGINQVNEGITTTVEKMGEITSGTGKLTEGAKTLTSGIGQLQSAANSSSQGASNLKIGVSSLKDQLTPLISSLPGEKQLALNQTLDQLSAGISALENGNKEMASAAEQLSSASTEITTQLSTLNEGQKALHKGLEELQKGTGALEAGAEQLNSGQQGLKSGLETFAAKLSDAKTGSETISAGMESFTTGVERLQEAAIALSEGADKLADGSGELKEGTMELMEGTEKFHHEISNAVDETGDIELTDEAADMIASPVIVKTEEINHVPNYGTGLTPYFLSLALFVGALTFTVVFPLRNPVSEPKSGFIWFISKFSVFAAVGTIQAVLMSYLLIYVLKIEVTSVPMFFLYAIITSLSFMALTQFFATTLNDPGRYFVIIIMILQLTTSAGTFPLEMIPESLQKLNPFFPMTYSVRGFKEIISTGNMSLMWSNASVLIGFMLAFMTLTLFYFIFKRRRAFRKNGAVFVD